MSENTDHDSYAILQEISICGYQKMTFLDLLRLDFKKC